MCDGNETPDWASSVQVSGKIPADSDPSQGALTIRSGSGAPARSASNVVISSFSAYTIAQIADLLKAIRSLDYSVL